VSRWLCTPRHLHGILDTGNARLVGVVVELRSAVDPVGEYQLFKPLHEARHYKTMVSITHRFGRLTKHADVILSVRDGRRAK
jgi:energy-coupling factor transporter ATP-binding protein EcfA2